MTWVYLHLAINHFPVVLTLLGTVAVLASLWWRRAAPEAWRYGLVTLVLATASAVPAWITGNQSHEVVEKRLGVKEGVVEAHELVAEGTLWVIVAMGGLGGFALWRGHREGTLGPAPHWVRWSVVAAAVAGSAMLGWTALLGGKITHGSEASAALRPDSALTLTAPSQGP